MYTWAAAVKRECFQVPSGLTAGLTCSPVLSLSSEVGHLSAGGGLSSLRLRPGGSPRLGGKGFEQKKERGTTRCAVLCVASFGQQETPGIRFCPYRRGQLHLHGQQKQLAHSPIRVVPAAASTESAFESRVVAHLWLKTTHRRLNILAKLKLLRPNSS